jgi:catechol 2,3-dioxygenase-like lactoylglutathione lyase family enzyme
VSVVRFEVGFVSADRALVDFLAGVFELEVLPPAVHPVGTLHRLRAPGAVIKVMVPKEPPKPGDGEPFLAVRGIRYLSLWTSDLDRALDRAIARGGRVLFGPSEHERGSRLAVIRDPDGNCMELIEAVEAKR